MRLPVAVIILLAVCSFARAAGGELVIVLPDTSRPTKAVAVARLLKVDAAGVVRGNSVTFSGLLPETAYDVQVTLADGTILNGVDLSWYSLEPPKQDAGDMDADDREQVRAIVQDVPSFYNKSNILRLAGDADRAVGLIDLVRDTDFHAGRGQVVWRIEVWYFKNQAGGWERVQQQGVVLDRQRFKDPAAYQEYVGRRRWLPELGGLRVGKDEPRKTVTLPPGALRPATAATSPTPASPGR